MFGFENVNQEAHQYLSDVPKDKWVLTFDKGSNFWQGLLLWGDDHECLQVLQ